MLMKALAFCRRADRTVSGTRPVEAGEENAVAAPPSACRTKISQMRAWPLTSRAPMAARIAKFAESDESITRRRGRRSATTPPINSVEIWASVQQAKAIPTSVAEPVRSRTANATAIGARFVPKNEIVRAPASRRKLRSRRGPSSGGRTLLPVAFQSRVGLPERHCAFIRFHVASGCGHITASRLAELLFRHTLADPSGPGFEPLMELGEMRL